MQSIVNLFTTKPFHIGKIFIKALCLYMLIARVSVFSLQAQDKKLDSLKIALKTYPQKTDEIVTGLYDVAVKNMAINAELAKMYALEILAIQNRVKDKTKITATYRIVGLINFYQSNYPGAIDFLNKSLDLATRQKQDLMQATVLSNIGTAYMAQSRFYDALKYFLSALKKFEKPENELGAGTILANIGIVYTEMGDLEQAMSYYNRALSIFTKHKNPLLQAGIFTNIATVFYKKKSYNKAIEYSRRALSIADSAGDLRIVARENGNLSGYYNELGQHDLALEFGLTAIAIGEKTNNKRSVGFNEQNVSAAYQKKGFLELAKRHGLSALNIAQALNITELKRDASLGLSELYATMAKPDSALFYYKAFNKFADSISNDKTKSEITKMGMRYEFDKTEALYKQKQLLADEQLKQQRLELALSMAEVQQGVQLRKLQEAQLQNEKLLNQEKQKQLIISQNNEKLQANKVTALSQQQKLNQLELRQVGLYGILAMVILISVVIYLLNLSRLRKLKYATALQKQEAEKNALTLRHQFQLSESELKAIRSQMNPHFIFNVLNSIESYVVDNDKKMASRLIQKFASLSRLILENSTKSLVAADKEWKALMLYTELEAIRYDNAFTYDFIIEEKELLKTLLLPPMLVQPLIENAILHGLIGNNKTDGKLAVTLKTTDKGICITVIDNGVGIENRKTGSREHIGIKEQSMGLESIQERIDMINKQYPAAEARFTIQTGSGNSGTVAILNLPLFNRLPVDK